MGYNSSTIKNIVLQIPTKSDCIRSNCYVKNGRKGSRV